MTQDNRLGDHVYRILAWGEADDGGGRRVHFGKGPHAGTCFCSAHATAEDFSVQRTSSFITGVGNTFDEAARHCIERLKDERGIEVA